MARGQMTVFTRDQMEEPQVNAIPLGGDERAGAENLCHRPGLSL
jgi:hypothetical protein